MAGLWRISFEEKLKDLHERVHRGSYRARPARRTYIPKADGSERPLSILCLEDKIVQQAAVFVLEAIYEEDFLGFSYGFRPGRGQHDALDALHAGIYRRQVNWVLDADIQGFFDAMAHSWIIRFLEHRIADKRILRLIAKWLKVGITEDGCVTRSERGAPQGAVISPILANVYLHYVFDLWTHRWRRKATGDVIVIRYADDTIVGFQHEHEAKAFLHDLQERMRAFELALHPAKTRLIRFGRHAAKQREKLGEGKPEPFDFLGFTHFCTRSRKWGSFVIGRKTIKKRMLRQLQAVKMELRKRMHDPIAKTGAWLTQMLKGHLNYYAVSGNSPSLWWYGLDPDKRSQLGAHYTDRDKIMLIIRPVIVEPLSREWAETKAEVEMHLDKAARAAAPPVRTKAQNEARRIHLAFLERLRVFRVLDPACGSGNFLYLALLALKDLEHRANLEAEALGLPRGFPAVGPECVQGIEINPYAAELARVSVWIGEVQWMRRNGFDASRNPILRPLDPIECRDALLNADGTEAKWPAADVIVGNPPFLGGKLLRTILGDETVERLFSVYADRVPQEADLVIYWFAKAWEAVKAGVAARVGLVSTNSIRGGANRRVLEPIASTGAIFDAWDDEEWTVEGADVRVSLVCFAHTAELGWITLDGHPVPRINSDLSAHATDLTKAVRLAENAGVAYMGDTKGGAFDVPGDLARQWLVMPKNPNGRANADVLRPWVNGMDITRRPSGKWIIDFGWSMRETEASFYQAPFAYCLALVKPVRDTNRRETYRANWWRHVEPRPGLFAKSAELTRWLVTPEVSRHRVFRWLDRRVLPDHKLQVIARDDDTSFGILVSRCHYLWSRRVGSWHGVGNDPRYTITTCFETFPFPDGLTPDIPALAYADDPRAQVIAVAARQLNDWRENWLNPPDLVQRVPEVVPGYPDRIVPLHEAAVNELKMRTLTNLYNQRPAWLANAHKALDEAVASAYGWPADLSDEEILTRLFAMNQARAAAGR